jgi:hypothetical protein
LVFRQKARIIYRNYGVTGLQNICSGRNDDITDEFISAIRQRCTEEEETCREWESKQTLRRDSNNIPICGKEFHRLNTMETSAPTATSINT